MQTSFDGLRAGIGAKEERMLGAMMKGEVNGRMCAAIIGGGHDALDQLLHFVLWRPGDTALADFYGARLFEIGSYDLTWLQGRIQVGHTRADQQVSSCLYIGQEMLLIEGIHKINCGQADERIVL